jgi:phospholipid/cholesterol/gamma-HCH transport system substrate-binding protein
MTGNRAAETVIGALVVATAALFLIYAGQTADLRAPGQTYALAATFRSVEGVSVGTDVSLAGIKIGTVTGLGLDIERFEARVTLAIDRSVRIPEDSDIRVSQEGLLGSSFLEITPGASDFMLAAGDEILNTQSSVSLLNLLLRFGLQE